MVKDDDKGWTLPQRKPITAEVLERAIATETAAARQEHQAREAWFDDQRGAVMLKLRDGRVFGAELCFIPSLQGASPQQLSELRASEDGTYLVIETLDLHVSVDGLVTWIMDYGGVAAGQMAERVAALKARGSLAKRAARAVPGDLGRILAKAGTATPIPGDELPEGWLDSTG